MRVITEIDYWLFGLINGLAGHILLLDALMKAMANDYGIIISVSVALLAIWFALRDTEKRLKIQRGVLAALASMGLANAAVALCNMVFFRIRPFAELANVHLLFYRPTDSSFPSNSASVLFSIAFSIYLTDKKLGRWFLLVAALQGFARVYVGIHYPFDILGGAILGGAVAYGVYRLFRHFDPVIGRLLGMLKNLYLA